MMLLPAEMKRALLVVHRSYLPACLSALHETGLMEITDIRESPGEYRELFRAGERTADYTTCTEYAIQIDAVLDALPPEEEGGLLRSLLFPSLQPPERVDRRPGPVLFEEADRLITSSSRAIGLRREIGEIDERLALINEWVGVIRLFEPLDIDLGHIGDSPYLSVRAVRVEPDRLDWFMDRLQGITGELVVDQARADEDYLVLVAVTRDHRDALLDLVSDSRFRMIDTGDLSGRPGDLIEALSREADDLRDRQKNIQTELYDLAVARRRPLAVMREEIRIAREREEVRRALGETRETVAIEGWVIADDSDDLEQVAGTAAEGHVICDVFDPETNPDGVPVAYDHPPWLRPFAFLTTMFSRPRYDEIDPTLFIGPTLVFFFGLMLGDAIYGAVIMIAAFMLYRGAGQASRTIGDASLVLLAAGAATVVWGVLQGGYCGDLLPRFLGITPPLAVISPLQGPIDFLVLALVIGLVQLNLGLVLAVFQNVRRGSMREIFHGQIPWFILQPSAAILLAGFFGWMVPDASLSVIAYSGAIIGLALLFVREGPLGFFSVTGYLGDWLSYARLLALALATGGIAMTINILAVMVAAIHPLMVIGAAVVWMGGHLFNFSLQSLGAFVHSLRLQYVEFFGRFYTGGGRAYTPFAASREITVLRGDE
ncbi:MAG: V-type ATP synthase subunit I [Methanomicrobiales archaeon]